MKRLKHFAAVFADRIDKHPAVVDLPDDAKSALLKNCRRRVWRDARLWAEVLAFITAFSVTYGLLAVLGWHRRIGLTWLVALYSMSTIGQVALGPWTRWRALRRALVKELRAARVRPGRCAVCDYSLTGIDSLACPECGEPLSPAAPPAPLP